MQRLVSLGILSRNTTSHTSAVMLITRKLTKDKRPAVDFKLLNTRIKRHNTATPLMRDICQMLGKAQSKILSCVDLRDAFHSLKLIERAKYFCGILPYFGSHHYRYEVIKMDSVHWFCNGKTPSPPELHSHHGWYIAEKRITWTEF